MTVQEIAPGVFVETGCTLVTVGAVLTDEGWICIDTPPMPAEARAWLDALRAISQQPVQYLVLTDPHRDRILGSELFGAPVVAHEASARLILDLKQPFVSQAADELSANDNDLVAIASLNLVPPQVSFSESMALISGGREVTLQHRPGPTRGSLWVIVSDCKVIFAGDSVVIGQPPLIADAATKQWLNALTELRRERYAGWIVVPGRGEPVRPAATAPLSEYLRGARRRIASLCRAGRPRSEVGGLVADFLTHFSYPPDRREEMQRRIRAGLEAIYDEIRAQDGGEESDEVEQAVGP